MKQFILLKAEIAKVKRIRKINNADIARLTGYTKNTIDSFMADRDDRKGSIHIARAIAAALNIDTHYIESEGGNDNG